MISPFPLPSNALDGRTPLAVIVTPPTYKASGGVTAGIELSKAIAKRVPYGVAIMGSRDLPLKALTEVDGGSGLVQHEFRAISAFGALGNAVPKGLQSITYRAPSLATHIRKTKPLLVHFHNPHPARALWHLARTCLDVGIPYVISSHGFVEFANPAQWIGSSLKRVAFAGLVDKPFREAVRHSSGILMTSPPENATLDILGVPLSKRHLVTNGHDPFFSASATQQDISETKAKFGIDSRVPCFFFLGNHTPNKGIDTLLAACHLAKVPWRLLVGGAIRDTAEHAGLTQTHRIQDLTSRVVFTDFLSSTDLRAVYQSVNAFVFPSRADTLPLVILDAMASGLPVIATRIGGIPFQVDESNGILIEPNSPEALAVAMDKLASAPDLRKQLAEGSRRRVNERFNWDVSAKSALNAYRLVLGADLRGQ
jgi:alpha-maltose-1-phosphate synthase